MCAQVVTSCFPVLRAKRVSILFGLLARFHDLGVSPPFAFLLAHALYALGLGFDRGFACAYALCAPIGFALAFALAFFHAFALGFVAC